MERLVTERKEIIMGDNTDVMVNTESEVIEEPMSTEEFDDEGGIALGAIAALGGVALAGAGAFVASRTKWGKAKLHDFKKNRAQKQLEKAQKQLEKLAEEETETEEKPDHFEIESN